MAQDQVASSPSAGAASGKEPWLEGVTLPPVPEGPAPIYKIDFTLADGSPLPATLSEDVPVLMTAQSEIFGEKPPSSWKDQTLSNSAWTKQTAIHWFFDDVAKNKSTLASCEEQLPANQMKVTPLDPCLKGAVTVFISRSFKYEVTPGQFKTIFATGGKSVMLKVTDITPPTCGIEVTAGGKKGMVWTVEAPANKYPLPKTAEVHFRGNLFTPPGTEVENQIPNVELGPNMVLAPEQCQMTLPKDGEISLKMVLEDNDKVDEKTLKYGICEVANGQPVPVGDYNVPTIKPASLKLPEKPYLFLEIKDMSGNHQVLCIPVSFK